MSFSLRSCAVRLAVTTLLASASCAGAQTWGFHLGSYHLPERHFNNVNPGVYYRAKDGWTGGIYLNSLSRTSVYAGYSWLHGPFGVTVGGVTGYKYALQPILVPSLVVFKHQDLRARLAYIPRVEKRIGSHVFHLMVEF